MSGSNKTPSSVEMAERENMNRAAESILSMTDRQAFLEVEAAGKEPATAAQRVRNLLRETVRAHKQKALWEAMAEYQNQVAIYHQKKIQLPHSPEGKRELLASVFQRLPHMQSHFLTVQHREFKEFSDDDVDSCLKQLHLLGAFEDGTK